jgi:7,8-dihydropterin-6-yl-methyl-4-(beta-D-ribofuranosyl)aminobenzene 5'-phosphate synthase
MLKFKILIDNRTAGSLCCPLKSEHGLSIFIEYNGSRILCDTGASAAFLENATDMGIKLAETDLCIISHGHSDHTGGLYAFLASTVIPESNQQNPAKVYLSGQIERERYFSNRREIMRDISTDHQIFKKYRSRLVTIGESQWITPEIAAVKCTCNKFPQPNGNKFLGTACRTQQAPLECITNDPFTHELALAIKTPQGIAIFSPCSHNGLFNIVDSCLNFTEDSRLLSFIGGLHLVDGCETGAEILEMARTFAKKYPDARLFTGHCTGDMAIEIFKSSLPDGKFGVFNTGFECTLTNAL